LAENDQSGYVAYVSEQNLLPDESDEPVGHPQAALIFDQFTPGRYHLRPRIVH
jgi:heat shock protein HspQ